MVRLTIPRVAAHRPVQACSVRRHWRMSSSPVLTDAAGPIVPPPPLTSRPQSSASTTFPTRPHVRGSRMPTRRRYLRGTARALGKIMRLPASCGSMASGTPWYSSNTSPAGKVDLPRRRRRRRRSYHRARSTAARPRREAHWVAVCATQAGPGSTVGSSSCFRRRRSSGDDRDIIFN